MLHNCKNSPPPFLSRQHFFTLCLSDIDKLNYSTKKQKNQKGREEEEEEEKTLYLTSENHRSYTFPSVKNPPSVTSYN